MKSKIFKTDHEWQHQLTPEQFRVTRQAGTERPFSGKYYDCYEDGSYHCLCCDALLFYSSAKFDAGCGWPSFWEEAVPGNLAQLEDYSHGMIRTEIRCAHCQAHIGHVFADGPKPTLKRYCTNSVALRLKKREE